jgi:hypothetical protein
VPRPPPPPPRDVIDRLVARFRAAPTRFALLIGRRRRRDAPRRTVATAIIAAGAVLASIGAMEGAPVPSLAGVVLAAFGLLLARRTPGPVAGDTGPRWSPKALRDLDRVLAEATPQLDSGALSAIDRIHDALLRLSREPRARWRLEDAVAVERLIERQLPEALAAASEGAGRAPLDATAARLAAIAARLAAPPAGGPPAQASRGA